LDFRLPAFAYRAVRTRRDGGGIVEMHRQAIAIEGSHKIPYSAASTAM
jgi:hypothetical protein